MSGDLDIPGGVITTHCVSSVIKPGSKQNHDPLQFVKIQSNELSRKAVEQIRLAEEVKITKEKIKEVEEEWQNNLLNWKSKRRQTRGNQTSDECESIDQQTRKIKTFSEIIKEKAKSGHRIGYNLDKYIDTDGDQFETDVHFVGNASNQYQPKPVAAPRMNKPPPPPPPVDEDMHLYENSPLLGHIMQQQEQQKQQKRMLSVSGRKKCSSCGDELGRGCAAMVIESLSLYYHINCFRCSVCHIQLGNGTCGTDVRVRNNKLHCKNCYSNDEG
ncbi:hypothetical protein B4U80_00452 [Leptotrombidium deliense]|uniref:LIM zinc-binding domain-containing protein n=1 Tax=Leptotrombidium deliense TaxID=299467 RepID=A0A443SI88_9ACAR|nr:hypothetical protein B4U80_00452 [Leptotrombidium deliense]